MILKCEECGEKKKVSLEEGEKLLAGKAKNPEAKILCANCLLTNCIIDGL